MTCAYKAESFKLSGIAEGSCQKNEIKIAPILLNIVVYDKFDRNNGKFSNYIHLLCIKTGKKYHLKRSLL